MLALVNIFFRGKLAIDLILLTGGRIGSFSTVFFHRLLAEALNNLTLRATADR